MQVTSYKAQIGSRILSLPFELRIAIWKLFFTDHKVKLISRTSRTMHECALDLAIAPLLTCKQIHQEAFKIFYRETTFEVSILHPKSQFLLESSPPSRTSPLNTLWAHQNSSLISHVACKYYVHALVRAELSMNDQTLLDEWVKHFGLDEQAASSPFENWAEFAVGDGIQDLLSKVETLELYVEVYVPKHQDDLDKHIQHVQRDWKNGAFFAFAESKLPRWNPEPEQAQRWIEEGKPKLDITCTGFSGIVKGLGSDEVADCTLGRWI